MRIDTQMAFDALKASPPVAVAASSLAGVNWSNVAYMLTAAYTAIMIGQHAWKHWIRPFVHRNDPDA